jgi:hypothetical protein
MNAAMQRDLKAANRIRSADVIREPQYAQDSPPVASGTP